MNRLAVLLLVLAAGCSGKASNEELGVSAILPQAITYQDIEDHQLHGASCGYAAEKSAGAIAMALKDRAVMKWDGAIRSFELDPLCEPLENGTGSRYHAPGYVLELGVEGQGTERGSGAMDFEGSVKLSDDAGRLLYSTEGHVQCGA